MQGLCFVCPSGGSDRCSRGKCGNQADTRTPWEPAHACTHLDPSTQPPPHPPTTPRAHVYANTSARVCTHENMLVYPPTRLHAHSPRRPHRHARTRTHMHLNARTQAHTHSHTRTRTHKHRHTDTLTQAFFFVHSGTLAQVQRASACHEGLVLVVFLGKRGNLAVV